MTNPKRIRVKGEECNYIMESVAPSKSGEKVKYNGEVYVKEELPSEYVMFEGIAYKRGVSIDEYNRKVMTESANGKVPSKIRLKGTNIVLESVGISGKSSPSMEGVGYGWIDSDTDELSDIDMFAYCVLKALRDPNTVIYTNTGESLETREMPSRIFQMANGFESAKSLEFPATKALWTRNGRMWTKTRLNDTNTDTNTEVHQLKDSI